MAVTDTPTSPTEIKHSDGSEPQGPPKELYDNEMKMGEKKTRKLTGTQQCPGTIIIKADILRSLKSDAYLKDLREKCRKVRRNVTGSLVLEISRETQKHMMQIHEAVAGKHHQVADMVAQTPTKNNSLKGP